MHSQNSSDWIVRFMHLAPRGEKVLDLACGAGRHTSLFAKAGYPVLAIDHDISQLGSVAALNGVEAVSFDLEGEDAWPFSNASFGAIVVTNYLHRPLFPYLISSLRDDGVLLYETFAKGNEQFGRPSNANFLLRPGELLEVMDGELSVVAYEHGLINQPRDAVVQRICAVKKRAPVQLPSH